MGNIIRLCKYTKIENVIEIMKDNDIHQLRLSRNGVGSIQSHKIIHKTNKYPEENNIHFINDNCFVYSVNPAIWKKNILIDIAKKHSNVPYPIYEVTVFDYTRQFNNCYYYAGEGNFTNGGEFLSSIYPFFKSTGSGKWQIFHSMPFSIDFCREYNIDLNKRGVHSPEQIPPELISIK